MSIKSHFTFSVTFQSYTGASVNVTISVGMCSYEVGLGKENFFKAADDSLYQAKRNGKNQTIIAETSKKEPV
ncbi:MULTISPECIES: diguanylate cyclase [unclassified Mesobacillus]|uniref:diguanylate cyclase domain-containing protein n=1 Tax=unclassified Mesobacillus TaxID=2675270 RepID=UPI002041CC7B|nr:MULTISPECIES: diguanylate cyclase [unclassified Mesobacillus]MCM3124361.1 diguanylate cyclase [Mesobacillus sp. MER 33]MCM3234929.1 diguanylate cyclase [Mesobacillus sp. MER 48]